MVQAPDREPHRTGEQGTLYPCQPGTRTPALHGQEQHVAAPVGCTSISMSDASRASHAAPTLSMLTYLQCNADVNNSPKAQCMTVFDPRPGGVMMMCSAGKKLS